MTNPNTTYVKNGIEAEKFVEYMTSSAYQAYQDNGTAAARLYD